MIKNLSDILVVTDVDGTLLVSEKGISQSNIQVIKLFTSLGGKFTIATGRSKTATEHIRKLAPINTPAILYNGGVIYDYENDKRLCYCALNKNKALQAINDIHNKFPNVGIEIMSSDFNIYLICQNESTYKHQIKEHTHFIISRVEDIQGEWIKVLFASDFETHKEIEEFVKTKNYEDICFVSTSTEYFEILPKGINKGVGLTKLCSILNHPIEDTYAIGDYNNDLEMITIAGNGVAVGNALPCVKDKADIIVGDCLDGGVAQLLYSLIKKYT